MFVLVMTAAIISSPVFAGSRAVVIEDFTFISSGSVGRAIKYMQSNLWDLAKKELERVLLRRPNNHYALYDLGVWYERAGNRDLAGDYYRQAIAIRKSRYYLNALARLDGIEGRGAHLYHRLFRCHGYCGQGNVYAKSGLWEEAVAYYEKAFNTEPRNHVACFHISVAYAALGDIENAIGYCELAINLKYRNNHKYVDFLTYLETMRNSAHSRKPAWEKPEPNRETIPDPYRAQPDPASRKKPSFGYQYVKVDTGSVRNSPAPSAGIVLNLPRGSRVEILETRGQWLFVRTFQKDQGWMPENLLSATVEGAWVESVSDPGWRDNNSQYGKSTSETTRRRRSREYMHIIDRGAEVAIRAEPSLLADVIHNFKPGEKVEILNRTKSNWIFVRTPAGPGYILVHYLEE